MIIWKKPSPMAGHVICDYNRFTQHDLLRYNQNFYIPMTQKKINIFLVTKNRVVRGIAVFGLGHVKYTLYVVHCTTHDFEIFSII